MAPAFTVGWVYNLSSVPESSGASTIVAVAIAFSLLSLFACALRLYCKLVLMRGVGLDDAAVLSSFLLGTAYCANTIYQTRWGFGLDDDQIPMENILEYSKVQYAGGPLYALGILGFKLSLLSVYHQLAGFKKLYRRVLWVTMALVTLNSVAFAFVFAFSCDPPAKVWDDDIAGSCVNEVAFYFAISGATIALDLLVIVLPFPIIQGLQLDVRKKIGLGALFGLGIFVTVVQILRVESFAKIKGYTDSQQPITWSMIEIHVGCLVACIPTYTPLLRKLGHKVTRDYRGNHNAAFRVRRWTVTSGLESISHRLSATHSGPNEAQAPVDTNKSMTCADDELVLWDTTPERCQAEVWAVPNAYRTMPVSRDGQSIDEDVHTGDSMEAKATPIQRDNEITVTQEIRITDVA
ncbi:hypothetical protein KC360_g1932 [Hortaea werneckii]|nr:hypothetical protein KC325_g2512 [Hortaea werneckii]KAI6997013.1 hypothetical protein KC359_g3162 [Hortaea werneckii]KAI7148090.1 hypothetical protein KC344_g2229 [Hortaea werneckii]KAI7177975.1 hypothetical protein KC360_g1932 [Hortaea werneckii]